MSGFFAVRSDREPVGEEYLQAIAAAVAHRGAARAWRDGDVALIAFDGRRGSGLFVADDVAVAIDARIDNARDLDRILGESSSDAERVAKVYRRWGADAPHELIGDMAGAIFDRRARALTVFRDRCAGRHAVTGRTSTRLIAGSSIAMLLADADVDRAVDEGWIAAYLTATAGFARATGYRDITRLVPGATARADGREWRVRAPRAWDVPRVRERDERAYAEGLRELLGEATRCRIDGAARVGVSLSGGLDSTSIAAAARAAAPGAEIVALAVPFSAPRADERDLQRMVAQHVGARLRWVPLDGADPYGDDGAERTLELLGVPPIAPNHFFVDRVAAAGGAEGVEVALDGIDGDAIVGGNWFFLADLVLRGNVRAFRRELHDAARVHGMPQRRIARRYVIDALTPPRMRRSEPPAFLDAGFVRRAGIARRMVAGPWAPFRSFAANELQAVSPGIAPAILEQIEEAWALRGVEVAHPFLDERVVRYCLGLPREQKIAGGLTKIVLRKAIERELPAAVTERSEKAELGSGFFDAIYVTGRSYTEEGLSTAASNLIHWVNSDWGGRYLRSFREDREGFAAFRLAFLSLWRGWASVHPRRGQDA